MIPILFTVLMVSSLVFIGNPKIIHKLIGLIATLIVWFSYLNVPHEIVADNNGNITFVSSWKTINVHVSDIKSINMSLWNGGFVTVYAGNAKINIFRTMTGLNELIKHIKSSNNKAIYKGNL